MKSASSNVKKFVLDGREIFVIDDFLEKKQCKDLFEMLNNVSYQRNARDSEETGYIRQWICDFDVNIMQQVDFYEEIQSMIKKLFPGEKFKNPYGVCCNNISFGDMLYPHRDTKLPEDITVMIYANEEWKKEWAGETIFYDDNGDSVYAVLPKPGRLVIFRGAIEHRASAPSRACYEARLTLVFKMEGGNPEKTTT